MTTAIDLERVREKRELQPTDPVPPETWQAYRELLARLDDPQEGDEDRLVELLTALGKVEADVEFDREVLSTHARLAAEYDRVAVAGSDRKTIDAEISRLVAEHEATLQKLRQVEQQIKAQRGKIETVDGDVMTASDRRYRLNLLAWEFAALLGIPRPADEPHPTNPAYTASGELTNAFLRRRQQLAEHDPQRLSAGERSQAAQVATVEHQKRAAESSLALNRDVQQRREAERAKAPSVPPGVPVQSEFDRLGRPTQNVKPAGPPAEAATAVAE